MKIESKCRKILNSKLGALFLELKEVGSSIGVTVLNTSSISVYTKDLTQQLYNAKIHLLPLDESDCCGCFKCVFFLRKLGSVIQLLATNVFYTEIFLHYFFNAPGEYC